MGMAASQARLLSITTRLTNNEFRSQMIANSKTRLANETQAASDEYMEALNATKLQYVYYDANGKQTLYDLTASTMLQYQPLKNQYALVNRAGQTMVNHGDATTFQQATNLDEFLELNNCIHVEEWQEPNPDYEEWKNSEPLDTDDEFYDVVINTDTELYRKFMTASKSCYDNAMGGSSGCYLHVLAHLLDYVHVPGAYPNFDTSAYPKTFNTTLGTQISISSGQVSGAAMHNTTNSEMISEVSQKICAENGDETLMAPDLSDAEYFEFVSTDPTTGTDLYRYTYEDENGIAQSLDYLVFHTGDATLDALLSNTKQDGSLKTMKEKVIDLFAAVSNYSGSHYDLLLEAIANFQTDMTLALKDKKFNKDRFDNAHKKWEESEPPEFLDMSEREVLDPDKEEWYTNLWYRMNGALFDEEFVEKANDEGYNNADVFHEKYFEKTPDAEQSWVEFDETLINSPEWLQFALETGEITLEKVVFNEDYDTTTELENKTWTATSWSSTADIVEVTDELAITKAEVKYNQALRDIQAKDKEYDNDIKKLDTEHNALQTEYDSIKGVLDKNMERSFKAFS